MSARSPKRVTSKVPIVMFSAVRDGTWVARARRQMFRVLLISTVLTTVAACAADADPPDTDGVVALALDGTCGNAIREGAERCDDGNPNSGDGCSAACVIESGYVCRVPGQACDATRCDVVSNG